MDNKQKKKETCNETYTFYALKYIASLVKTSSQAVPEA